VPIDFQVAFPQEVIQLDHIRAVPGTGRNGVPRALEVTGADFGSVDEILINAIPSPDIIVVGKHRLIAQVPDSLQNALLTSVSVLSRRLVVTDKSYIRFRIGKTPGRVTGMLRLVQLFLKLLFTTPGSDIFSPKLGGGALKNLGQTFGANDGGNIVSDFIIAVNQTARQIVAVQGRDSHTPRNERLLSARVLHAGFNRAEGALVVSVELVSQAGRSALASLEL